MRKQFVAVTVSVFATIVTALVIVLSLQFLSIHLGAHPAPLSPEEWSPETAAAFMLLLSAVSIYIVALPSYRLARVIQE